MCSRRLTIASMHIVSVQFQLVCVSIGLPFNLMTTEQMDKKSVFVKLVIIFFDCEISVCYIFFVSKAACVRAVSSFQVLSCRSGNFSS